MLPIVTTGVSVFMSLARMASTWQVPRARSSLAAMSTEDRSPLEEDAFAAERARIERFYTEKFLPAADFLRATRLFNGDASFAYVRA